MNQIPNKMQDAKFSHSKVKSKLDRVEKLQYLPSPGITSFKMKEICYSVINDVDREIRRLNYITCMSGAPETLIVGQKQFILKNYKDRTEEIIKISDGFI